jgi:hypothetical protein
LIERVKIIAEIANWDAKKVQELASKPSQMPNALAPMMGKRKQGQEEL